VLFFPPVDLFCFGWKSKKSQVVFFRSQIW
jgi:hypothetical protein